MSKFDYAKWAARHLVSSSGPVARELEEGAQSETARRLEINEVIRNAGGRVQEVEGKPTRRRVELINEGWGSSGFYPTETLQRAAKNKIFHAGLHMYMNHPSRTEDRDQPERRVEHLAAVLATDAVFRDGGLFAEAEIFSDWNPVVEAKADHIGLSIRAMGESIDGEVEGKIGPIITDLTEAISTDFVTHAGRGGKVLELIESAVDNRAKGRVEEARNVGEWLEAFIHSTFTARVDDGFGEGYISREERLALSSAIGAALDAFHSDVKENAPQLYERDPFSMPDPSELDVEEGWPNRDKRRNSGGDDQKEVTRMGDEERLSALETRLSEMESKHADELAEKDQEIQEARDGTERAEDALIQEKAKTIVAEVLDTDDIQKMNLPERAAQRIERQVLGSKLPIVEGELEREVFEARILKAAREERDYLKPASKRGRVTDVGGHDPLAEVALDEDGEVEGETPLTEAEKKALEDEFGKLGLDESQVSAAMEV